jgi:acetyl-CoA carboxylase biotin carboxyl carrier protein
MNDQNKPESTGAAPAREPQREGVGQPTDARAGATDFGGRRGQRRRHGGREGQPQQQPPSRARTEQSINMDELRELFGLISAQGFTEFELEKEGFRVRLRRDPSPQGSGGGHTTSSTQPINSMSFTTEQTTARATTESTPPTTSQADTTTGGVEKSDATADAELFMLTSPIVGTFYRSPSPAADPFVRSGSHVEPDTVVCIVEAMKLMNEIQAETTGTVEKIYVENGQAVEYGQPLFGIRK